MNKEEARRAVLSEYDSWVKKHPNQASLMGGFLFFRYLQAERSGLLDFRSGWQQVANRSRLDSRSLERLENLLPTMSALPPKADIGTELRNVRFVPKADVQALAVSLRNAPSGTIYQLLRGNRCQALPHAPFETRPPAPSLWPVLGRMDPIGVARRKNRPHKDRMECRSASEDGSENPHRDSPFSGDPG